MLSGLYDQLGETEQGYARARSALEFVPEHPEALLAAGYLAGKLGRLDESVAWLQRLLEGQRDEGFKSHGRLFLLHLGEAHGRPDLEAVALAGEVPDMTPEELTLRRAEALGRAGDEQAQYEVLAEGCVELPTCWNVRFALADCLVNHGHDQEAVSVLGAALDLADIPAELYRRLSLSLMRLDRVEEASDALQLYAHAAGVPDLAAVG
jgi:Flp pilus assembly protein TadD